MSKPRPLTIALMGNPNSGKTTLFNALTGARQHVGNYPGVTVEKKSGTARYEGENVGVVDLPGTYSLTAYSIEEIIARDFVIDERPDVVVDIIDASNLERNLYLATQLLELGTPLVLALNMSDVAERRGFRIDTEMLSRLLGVPIVTTIGHKSRGVDEMLAVAVATARAGADAVARQRKPDYGSELEPHVQQLTERIAEAVDTDHHQRWYAVKLLEGDERAAERLTKQATESLDGVFAEADRLRGHLEKVAGDSAEIILADRRYGFISGACTEAVSQTVEARHARSDRIDAVVTHRALGMPLFGLLMYLMFYVVFTLGEAPMDWIEQGFGWLSSLISAQWPAGDESLLRSLLVDGIIGGVGGVLVFLPNIILLFGAIAILEDTGYMARAAFIMDRLMHKIGLHGKSFIPMLTGFGCSVPAIMATRTLESRRDRLVTMLVVPLMSCGARLPIYALLIPAFFPLHWRAPVLWSIYAVGVALAVLSAKLLRATLFRGESVPFVMELPPYRIPTFKGLLVHVWEPTVMYARKAGTVILAFSILMWAITTFPRQTFTAAQTLAREAEAQTQALAAARKAAPALELGDSTEPFDAAAQRIQDVRDAFDAAVDDGGLDEGSDEYVTEATRCDDALAALATTDSDAYAAAVAYGEELEQIDYQRQQEALSHTVAGRLGRGMAPVIKPLGFDWKIGTALIGALGAKEVFVAQMGIVYAAGGEESGRKTLRAKIYDDYKSPLVGYCIMLFCLTTAPCLATIVVTRRESGLWRWAIFQLVGLSVLAYVVTLVVYQVGRLFM